MKKKIAELRRRRAALVRCLQDTSGGLLRGTLIERYKRCGKAGCKCATGRGHGPKYYLSVSLPGVKPEMIYVPRAYIDRVDENLQNLAQARDIIEQICEINRLLLREREL